MLIIKYTSAGETREGAQSLPLEVHSAAVSSTPTLLSDVELPLFVVFFCTGSSQSHDINKRFHPLRFARRLYRGEKGDIKLVNWKSVHTKYLVLEPIRL